MKIIHKDLLWFSFFDMGASVLFFFNPSTTVNPFKCPLANSEDPDEMPHLGLIV